jgi:hypothetical protein
MSQFRLPISCKPGRFAPRAALAGTSPTNFGVRSRTIDTELTVDRRCSH